MIQNIYFKIACALIILFMICCFLEKKVNKYSYEKGSPINKVKLPDIIQESVPIVRNLDVVSDLFTSFISFIFIIIFIINGKYQYIIFYSNHIFIQIIFYFYKLKYFLPNTKLIPFCILPIS